MTHLPLPRPHGRAHGLEQDERGSVALETVLLVPVLVLVLCVLAAGWRIWSARTAVRDAASSAARAATVETSGASARDRAQQVAEGNLAVLGVGCTSSSLTIDTAAFARPVGTPGDVEVQLSCTITLSDLAVPGLPGQMQVSAVGRHPLDTFRERRP